MSATCQTCGNKVEAVLAEVPERAIRLNEDATALSLAAKFVATVDPDSIAECNTVEQRQVALDALDETISLLRRWHRVAKRTLAAGYLAP